MTRLPALGLQAADLVHEMGARGVWWGLAIGLAMAALTLGWRMMVMMKHLASSSTRA